MVEEDAEAETYMIFKARIASRRAIRLATAFETLRVKLILHL